MYNVSANFHERWGAKKILKVALYLFLSTLCRNIKFCTKNLVHMYWVYH